MTATPGRGSTPKPRIHWRLSVAVAWCLLGTICSARSSGAAAVEMPRMEGPAVVRAANGEGPAVVRAANVGGQVPVAVAPTADGRGFWIASTDGGVAPEGDAPSFGDASSLPLNAPVVSMARTATGKGYWLMGGDGGVYTFGDAGFYGSTGSDVLNQPALQIVSTPTGHGYWIVARDGGVFTFGDARFFGSTGALELHRPVVGMAATPDGRGYWLVASDGGIFAFGDAPFLGSTGAAPLNRRVVAMAATPDGHGYWLVASDGGVFSFGDARFFGSAAGMAQPAPAIGLVPTGDGLGYWIILANGTVLSYGDAPSETTPAVASTGFSLAGRLVTVDPGHNGGNGADPGYIDQLVDAGGFLKACNTTGTSTDSGYTEAAFNFDVATRLAADLRRQGATVVMTRDSNDGVGPCVDQRAAIANQARSDAAVSIHADGGPAAGRGFSVDEPLLDPGYNDGIIATSQVLGADIIDAYASGTPMPVSDYTGEGGVVDRDDLGGLDLSTVPIVLVESGNMRNATDATLLEDPTFRQQEADALARGISTYLLDQ